MAIDQPGLVINDPAALQGALTEKFGDILYVHPETWPDLSSDGWRWLANDVDGLDGSRIDVAREMFGMRFVIIGDQWDEELNAPRPEVSRRGIYVQDPLAPTRTDTTRVAEYWQRQQETFNARVGEPYTPKLAHQIETKESAGQLTEYGIWFAGFVAELGTIDPNDITARLNVVWDEFAAGGASLAELRGLITDVHRVFPNY